MAARKRTDPEPDESFDEEAPALDEEVDEDPFDDEEPDETEELDEELEETDDLDETVALDDEAEDPTAVLPEETDGDEVPSTAGVTVPPEAEFDDEDDELVAVVTGEDDDEDVDGIRDGEFVCRSCFLAKRETQLADPDRMLCRDCA